MKRGVIYNRRFSKYSTLLNVQTVCLGCILLTIVYDSWIQYRLNAASWVMPSITNKNDEVRLLFVADPQLIGEKDETGLVGMVTRWDSDRYLQSTYSQAVRVTQPHAIIFMGDLLDEGTRSYDKVSWSRYASRFYNIFGWPNVTKIYIPGDNDIGGEGGEPITSEHVQRFKETFSTLYGNPYNVSQRIRLISWPYGVPSSAYAGSIVPFDSDKAAPSFTISKPQLQIALSHIPLLRYLRENDATSKLLKKVKPQIIMAAHDHTASHLVCQACLTPTRSLHLTNVEDGRRLRLRSDNMYFTRSDIHELQVPTCSYRMGVGKMAYGLLTISVNKINGGLSEFDIRYTLLWLPARFPRLYFYLLVGGSCFIIFVIYRIFRNKTSHKRW